MVSIRWDRIFITAVVVTVVNQIIHSLGAIATMDYYTDPAYAAVWSRIMMPTPGPPPTSFYVYAVLFGFISASLVTTAFSAVRAGLAGRNWFARGMFFGMLLFLVAGLPGQLGIILLFNVPLNLVAYWGVESLVISAVDGVVISLLNRGKGQADKKA